MAKKNKSKSVAVKKVVKDKKLKGFKVGDVVYLKSGGDKMVIEQFYDEGSLGTVWMGFNHEPYRDTFAVEVLTHKDPDEYINPSMKD